MGPIHSEPRGAGGLRNPVLTADRALEATAFRFALELDPPLAEIGQHYDLVDDDVNGPPFCRTYTVAATLARAAGLSTQPLAAAVIRRDIINSTDGGADELWTRRYRTE